MTTSMMHLWLRNQLLQTVPIVLILPDWQDIYSYYQFLFTSNPTSPPPPSPPHHYYVTKNWTNSPFALQET